MVNRIIFMKIFINITYIMLNYFLNIRFEQSSTIDNIWIFLVQFEKVTNIAQCFFFFLNFVFVKIVLFSNIQKMHY